MANGAGSEPKPVNLGLQGGGAHGAFTWGVLDRLLEDGRLSFPAISGTSAGAMNAVVLADGLARGGPEAARERLATFWRGVSLERVAGPAQSILGPIFEFWNVPPAQAFPFMPLPGLSSPHSFNPLNINPLREVLEELVDFARVRAAAWPHLYLSATNVRTGKVRIFSGKEIGADAVMASACLPQLFHAVEIAGEAFWDGGFSGNPALFPFFAENASADILLVQINPVQRDVVPLTGHEISERLSEITFNASLLRELRAIDFVNRLIDEKRLDPTRYRRHFLHRIDATSALAEHGASTRLSNDWSFLQMLRDAGRAAAENWLKRDFRHVGVRATLDLRAEFA